jgi:DNA-binding transcriptional LysR family regulator
MELNWLEDFLALAASGNFSRAADSRNMTQPAFSRRIRALEDWVGAPLFDRGGQPVTLTAAGRHFVPVAQETLRRLAQGRDEAAAAMAQAGRSLTFAATHALSLTFFPGWLRGLESDPASIPEPAAIRLISDSMQAGEEALLQGLCQFLLCHGHPAVANRLGEDRFGYRVLAGDDLMPVSAPAAKDGGPRYGLDTATGAGLPHLAYSEASGMGRIVTALLPRGAPALTPVFISPLAGVLQAMARDGRGLAWLPRSLIAADLAAGRLVPAGGDDWVFAVEIRLYRPRAALAPAAEEFWSRLAG